MKFDIEFRERQFATFTVDWSLNPRAAHLDNRSMLFLAAVYHLFARIGEAIDDTVAKQVDHDHAAIV